MRRDEWLGTLLCLGMTYPSSLSDTEWDHLQCYLPPIQTRGRPRSHSLRAILNAIFYLLRTGCPWRYLPRDFPPWQTLYYHFRRFRLSGMWHLILTSHSGTRSGSVWAGISSRQRRS
jgi:putative transposase